MKLENLNNLVDSYLLTPNSKHHGENLYLKRLKQRDGSDGWYISNDSERTSLNARILLFCHEPSNSSKDETFFKEHRFPTKEAALEVLKKYFECDWISLPEFKDENPNELRYQEKIRQAYKDALADIF